MIFDWMQDYKRQKRIAKDCQDRLFDIRKEFPNADSESRLKLRGEAEIIAKELSTLRVLQGQDRIISNLIAAMWTVIGTALSGTVFYLLKVH